MPTVWPYEPEAGISESILCAGEVIQSADTEARASFHAATRKFALTFPLGNAAALLADEIVAGNMLGEWTVPVWTERQTVSVSASDTSISCDVNNTFAAGGSVIVWSAPDDYSTATIDAVGGSSLTLTGAIGGDHTNAVLMPLGTAYAREWRAARRGPYIKAFSAVFEFTDLPDMDPGAEISQFPLVDSIPVLGGGYAVLNQANVTFSQQAEWLDSGYGTLTPSAIRDIIDRRQVVSLHVSGNTERHALIKLLHSLRGRDGAFWAVEPGGNIAVVSKTATTITIPKIAATASDLDGRRFQTPGGTNWQVTSAADAGDNQVLTIPSLSESFDTIYLLRRYRSDTDEFQVSHMPRPNVARTEFACLEVSA